MFYNTFLEHSKNYNYTCKNISFGAFCYSLTNYPPTKALFKPFCMALARVNLLYSAFVYILGK